MTQEHNQQESKVGESGAEGQIPIDRPLETYRFQVDKGHYQTDQPTLTGLQILNMAGKNPAEFKLYELRPGHQPVEVKADDTVDLSRPGVERFTTMPRDTTEGRGTIRKEFRLASEDENYLDSTGLNWESVNCSGQWLLLHGWRLPTGFAVSQVSLALLIPPSYPDAQLDMVYVTPAIVRNDGKPINAVSNMDVCGGSWQRWSRHRSGANPWRPGIDDIASHLSMVDSWFRTEAQ